MPTITADQAGGLNVCAFMDMIAVSEGTSTSPITQCDGYDIIVTGLDGRHRFDDMSCHPFEGGRSSIVINHVGLTSNAAGRYQQMLKDWPHYRDLLKLPDFGFVSQDLVCLQHIKECGAIGLLQKGNFAGAVAKCNNIWASLAGAKYGQPTNTFDMLRAAYILNGGAVA
ncbi:glycoside hydrolase family 104 protein [Caballeronia sp. dw_19]|uniref:glycoside hydrolase family 24 protein n=1 Tax=Caballeronia sp. dw_19 TaxID=2719791 RepID=UPI001BD11C55|nr:glycoside hydrolase family 104 protein [Caballeronia sp. dw_19]